MKLFKSILFGAIITLCGTTISAQGLELPADPAPDQFDFVHRTLVVQYTGTKCPNCHYMIKALDQLKVDANYKNKFNLAVCHSYGGDPMLLDPDNVTALYSLGEIPRALVGFTEKINSTTEELCLSHLKKAIDNSLQWKIRAGIAVNSKLEGNTLTVKAALKAAKSEDEYSLGCWLLEDGIMESQSSMGTISHDEVIRFAEKAYGNDIGVVEKGETAETTFTIPMNNGWKKENCKLLLYVCFKTSGKTYIGNAITVPLEKAVPYEYQSLNAINEVEANNDIQIAYLSGDQLEVSATSPIEEVVIYNMQGRLMLQLTPQTEVVSLSLSSLPAGVYTLRATHDNDVKTQKIIKP